jgi:LDH2 family malate/lactate/ureidoglycolate dehydrogenase
MLPMLENHRRQIELIFLAWGMTDENAVHGADALFWADLHGVDSHGISHLTVYEDRLKQGRFNPRAASRVVRETPVSALLDGDGGLGHAVSVRAMSMGIEKARTSGVAVISVRNSAHFGAAGYYSKMAADAGLIGFAATSATGILVAPTGAAQARLGTDPWSFAAPTNDEPVLLDMATTTAAAGKIRNRANEGLPCPPGWVVTKTGAPSTDPLEATAKGGFMTPLGGTPEGSSHKGYGLSVMVNILSSALSGATMITDPMHTKKPQGMDIGHFFQVINPELFRDGPDFRGDVTAFRDTLRASAPIDRAEPVMVAGDPERKIAANRSRDGIPIAPNLREKLKTIARDAGAPWVLD